MPSNISNSHADHADHAEQGREYFLLSEKMFGSSRSMKQENLEKLAKILDLEVSWIQKCIKTWIEG